ncbi:hypothetical protein [Olleya aquimaris]|uniref:DUF541 domain-containing protein n=1 Tax=Olleya aquimaris TaxID=639310 RepID=A0A327R7Y2_9FLAO|nr:hypothetical protein [Olleya aquimaris]RAJ11794.1 hypothetical protein LY08_02679 [Olleya aquimaris]
MKLKWYFGALLTALAFFVVSQQQITVPNQEIVLLSSGSQVTTSQTEQAITAIKTQLKRLGIENTQVLEDNGVLKITYYSDIDVESVKRIVLEGELSYVTDKSSDVPQKDNYKFEVFEINTPTESGIGFDGKYSVEVKQEYTRSSQITVSYSAIAENIHQLHQLIQVAQKANTSISISIDKGTFNIPEVRAGPTA